MFRLAIFKPIKLNFFTRIINNAVKVEMRWSGAQWALWGQDEISTVETHFCEIGALWRVESGNWSTEFNQVYFDFLWTWRNFDVQVKITFFECRTRILSSIIIQFEQFKCQKRNQIWTQNVSKDITMITGHRNYKVACRQLATKTLGILKSEQFKLSKAPANSPAGDWIRSDFHCGLSLNLICTIYHRNRSRIDLESIANRFRSSAHSSAWIVCWKVING